MDTQNALIMFCEKCEIPMNLKSFEYDKEFAWYEFECLNCARKRLISITLHIMFDQEIGLNNCIYSQVNREVFCGTDDRIGRGDDGLGR